MPTAEDPPARGRLFGPAVCAAGLAWVALILGIHRESPYTLVSAHGFLHSAIAERFLIAPGVLPPENPFFAGEPLAYYWTFHALAAALAHATGLDVLHAFEIGVVLSAFGLVVLSAGLARSLYGRTVFGLVLSFLVMAGAHAQAPLVLLWRRLRIGHWPEDDGSYLWGLVHPVSEWMRVGDAYGQLGPLLSYYLNITSRPLALTTLVGLLWALHVAWRSPRRGGIGLVVTTLLVTLWSPIIAIAGGLSLVGAVLVVEVARRAGWVEVGDRPLPWVSVAAAIALGLLLPLPTYAHLLGGASGEGSGLLAGGLDLALEHGRGALGAGFGMMVLAAIGWIRAPRELRGFLLVCGVAALPLLAATVLIVLPAGNFVNFFHVALVFLAIPATAALRGRGGELTHAWVPLALFGPTLLLVVWTYTGRPPTQVVFRDGHLVQQEGPLAKIYGHLREQTPPDAVVAIDPGPPTRASQGNTAELPALTGRVLLTERAEHYIVAGHPRASDRVAAARALARGEAPSADQMQLLRELERPVLVLVEGDHRDAAARRFGPPLLTAGPWALHRVPL